MRIHLTLPVCFAVLTCSAPAQLWVSSDFNHEVLQFDPQTGAAFANQPLVAPASGGLNQPHGIIDRRSGVLVASFGTHEVKRYDRTSGIFLDDLVPSTAGLNSPVYLAIGPRDGYLYISSQGNDRIMRFNLETGAPIDPAPFIEGGSLDGPSGFGWSPDASLLYVAGRYSANVLTYNATSGAALAQGHVFASGLGAGDTFGLAVDRATGDVFVASGGNVLRFSPAGGLLATIITSGAIGLENSPDGNSIYAAAENNLYRIDKSDDALTGPLLNDASINVLNFFHFSRVAEPELSSLAYSISETMPDDRRFEFFFSAGKLTSGSTVVVSWSEDFNTWNEGAVYSLFGQVWERNDSTATVPAGMSEANGSITITERGSEPLATEPRRFYRVSAEGK